MQKEKKIRREWEKIVQEVLDLSCSVNRKSMASALRVLTYFSFSLVEKWCLATSGDFFFFPKEVILTNQKLFKLITEVLRVCGMK